MVTGARLRIAFFGTPEFAVPTLQALMGSAHGLVTVVSQPDRPKGRGQQLQPTPAKRAALQAGVQVLQPERLRDEEFVRILADLDLDLAVVAAYGKILPECVLALPRLGMINVHASILPEYRGAAPVHRAVIDGRSETGVTIMRVVPELDAGPMLATVRHAIGPDDTSQQVEETLGRLGAELLVAVVDDLAAGRAHETAQVASRATYAPKIVKSEGRIDWGLPATRIHNLVRGLQPWPLVSVAIDGRRYRIHRTARTNGRSTSPGGTVVEAGGGTLSVAAGDGEVLNLVDIQPEGRRVMTARELLAGHPIRAGARLDPA